jgi:hypothetical protein
MGYTFNNLHMIFEICRHIRKNITSNNSTHVSETEIKLEPVGSSTRYGYLGSPLSLEGFSIFYSKTPVVKSYCMPVLLAPTHHVQSTPP